MRRAVSFALLGLTALWAAPAIGATAPSQPADPAAAPKASILFTKLEQRLSEGETYLFLERGPRCDSFRQYKAKGGTRDVSGLVRTRLDRDLRDYGFNTNAPTTSGFNGGPIRVFELSGVVRRLTIKACVGRNSIESRTTMEIAWQLYSRADRSVVARITTEAVHSEDFDSRDLGDEQEIEDVERETIYGVAGAVAANVRDLVAHPNLRKALMAEPDPASLLPAADLLRISASAAATTPRTVAQAATGVVLIVTPNGHGSGALVSPDGYVLTNEHVVGPAKSVTVRWSDHTETPGEVVRVHKGRDVALIKTDPTGHAPLGLRTELLDLGEAVLAIGAPLDEELQGTVTRGIVSTPVRRFQGYNFIQSDVAVTFGNSGGALIDDKSRLVGLADLGYQPELSGNSLNLFIPIKEALDYVGLDLTAPRQPEPRRPVAPSAARNQAGRPAATGRR